MDFNDSIKNLSERLQKIKSTIKTEEATKNALIMPFIQILGYDVFNPLEVVPEFVADIGIKKGEKVDYAILKDNKPTILIECKSISEKLDIYSSQLFRYFHATKAKFAILTNGVEYLFYSDLMEVNKMDSKPFLSFQITNLNERVLSEIKKFHKSYFDINIISNSANELKYYREINVMLNQQLEEPTENFIRFFINNIYSGRVTKKILTIFTDIVKKSFSDFIKEQVNDRIKSALEEESAENVEKIEKKLNKIITTEEEIESYLIIKSILRKSVDIKKITYRDVESYFGILFDNNNRKPICRMYLNATHKYISLFNENKEETKKTIESLDDIYKYSGEIIKIAEYYQSQSK